MLSVLVSPRQQRKWDENKHGVILTQKQNYLSILFAVLLPLPKTLLAESKILFKASWLFPQVAELLLLTYSS